MSSLILDSSTRRFSIAGIGLYQRYISPRKGFGCAHRIVHNGESCSARVKRALYEEPLSKALGISRRQFGDCSEASRLLRARNNKGQARCIIIPCCLPL